jgi:hypothetical protein
MSLLWTQTGTNSYSSGSAQRSFVQSDLQSASTNPSVKWIIVYLHKPMYTSPDTCGSSWFSNTGSENTNLRNGFHAMFDQYGVDLVLQGPHSQLSKLHIKNTIQLAPPARR